jgi:oligoendopeptidase F
VSEQATITPPTDPAIESARDVAWDLEPIVDGRGDAGVDELLDRADVLAEELGGVRGRVNELVADELVDVMTKLSELGDIVGRAESYAGLWFSVDMQTPARGALMQRVEERATAIATKLLFFDLEWAAVDDDRAEALLADPRLEFCRHHLRSLRRYRPHLLSEPEERILTEKGQTGRSAWVRLFDELEAEITVDLDGQTVSLEEGLSRLHHHDRALRQRTASAVTEALGQGIKTRAFIFNTLALDKSVDDRLRSYPHWLASRNLANEASDESVAALVQAVRHRYDLPQRWYRTKARLLGLDRLADYDRMASVAESQVRFDFGTGRDVVLDAYESFSPDLASVARRFFDEHWIDAPVRQGKSPGAFSAATVPSQHPYVLLNWTANRNDVLTLAHELGHGVHQFLARERGVFHQNTPLTVAETASVFGETVTFGRLLAMTTDPAERLALLAENVEGAIGTVFRQTAMNRFEELVHTERRSVGELAVERFNELWEQSQSELFGDSVEISPGYRTWWSYIPHFIGVPGYVYAYAFGQLLAMSVYARFEEQGPSFVPQYLEMLASGGSRSPEELGRLVDCDLADPGFWDGGLHLIERRLDEAEDAARAAGRL